MGSNSEMQLRATISLTQPEFFACGGQSTRCGQVQPGRDHQGTGRGECLVPGPFWEPGTPSSAPFSMGPCANIRVENCRPGEFNFGLGSICHRWRAWCGPLPAILLLCFRRVPAQCITLLVPSVLPYTLGVLGQVYYLTGSSSKPERASPPCTLPPFTYMAK